MLELATSKSNVASSLSTKVNVGKQMIMITIKGGRVSNAPQQKKKVT